MLDKQKSKYLILSVLCFVSAFVLLASLKPLALFVGLFIHWVGVEYGEGPKAIAGSAIIVLPIIGLTTFIKTIWRKRIEKM